MHSSVKRNELQLLMPNQAIRNVRILKSEQSPYYENNMLHLN